MAERNGAPIPLKIVRTDRGGVHVLKLSGDLDSQGLPAAKTALSELLDSGRMKILLDVEDVAFIDSAGLGFFIGTLKKMKELGGELKLYKLNAYMLGIFRLLRLDYVLELYDDMEKALASFDGAKAAHR